MIFSTHKIFDRSSWKEVVSDSETARFITLHFFISVLFFAISLSQMGPFLRGIEKREGVFLPDPILGLYTTQNATWLTFLLIYGAVALGLHFWKNRPILMMRYIKAYGLLVCFRMIGMHLTALEPPKDTLILADPFVEFFTGTKEPYTKDLFFSGHTSSAYLFALVATQRWQKTIFVINAAAIAVCVLLQKVHYSIDVYCAPFFAYGAYSIILWMDRKFFGIQE
jgi:hypothetical protein